MAAATKGSRTASSKSKRSSGSGKRSSKSRISFFGSLVELVTMTFFGKVTLVLLIGSILVGINLLVTKNRYDTFYLITGIELIAAILIAWLRILLRPED